MINLFHKCFFRYGLETWGSDEMGIGTTRRFLLEYLSFACRYVPIGILERLPPNLQDRPPAYRGRDDLETLLSSPNVKDWIKIRYLFLLCPPLSRAPPYSLASLLPRFPLLSSPPPALSLSCFMNPHTGLISSNQ